MAKTKEARLPVLTPAGTFAWAYLDEPDGYGNYKVTTRLSEEDARGIIDEVTKFGEKQRQILELQDEEIHAVSYPWEDNDDGTVSLKFRVPAEFTSKKTKQVFVTHITLVDAKKNAISQRVYSGSVGKVLGYAKCHLFKGNRTTDDGTEVDNNIFYVSLRLQGAQVLEMAEAGAHLVDEFSEEEGFTASVESADFGSE